MNTPDHDNRRPARHTGKVRDAVTSVTDTVKGLMPSKDDLTGFLGSLVPEPARVHPDAIQFAPGGFAVGDTGADDILPGVERRFHSALADGRIENTADGQMGAQQIHALYHRTASVCDLTPEMYRRFADDPASMANWLPPVVAAVTRLSEGEEAPTFAVPATRVVRLPIELAQVPRISFGETTPATASAFNRIIADVFDLNIPEAGADTTPLFIKTGTFSSKFEFANARCVEPDEMGDYFRAITNNAMMVGAGECVDLVVREWIEPAPSTPTIYHGMPLRTEFRAFIDLGGDEEPPVSDDPVLGITPYWHPSVMQRALFMASQTPGMDHVAGDFMTYTAALPALTADFDARVDEVAARLRTLAVALRDTGMRGAWSIDIMADNREGYNDVHDGVLWLIDAAPMHTSALTDLLLNTDEYTTGVDRERLAALSDPLTRGTLHEVSTTRLTEVDPHDPATYTVCAVYDSVTDEAYLTDPYRCVADIVPAGQDNPLFSRPVTDEVTAPDPTDNKKER